ncbi:MAG TPA: C25 family cysteine peptidase, partial [Ignavibacteriaceae bacterium]|nr:C25 family cysteine peptidase [Ignavibacteriaceae bacterium]
SNDYIQFYGTLNYPKLSYRIINQPNEPYNEYLNRYCDTTFYFLTWGLQNGKRIVNQNVFNPGISDSLTYFKFFEHIESNVLYQNCYTDEVENQTPGWLRNKTWYFIQTVWFYSNTIRNYNFNVTDYVANKTAKFFYKAVSFGSNIISDAHQLILKINNALIDSQSINRNNQILLSGGINTNQFVANQNVLSVKNYANSSSVNVVVPDWYDIEYPRYLKLQNNFLLFTVPDDITNGLMTIKIQGAAAANYEIYKVKPYLKKIENYQIISNQLLFTDTVRIGDQYIVQTPNSIGDPVYYYKKQFVNLRSKNAQIDYLAITHPKFFSSAQNYVNSVSSMYEVTSDLISVEDIFDEFSFGYPQPEAIRLFTNVTYVNRESPKPQYLLLIGDANYDYKLYRFKSDGVKGGGNYVPGFGNPISDNWLVVWDESVVPVPQLKVGRIPINKSEELDFYLTKVQNNFNQRFDEWNKEYLFFSGGRANEPGEIAMLKGVNDQVINNFVKPEPLYGAYSHFYKTSDPMTDFGPYTPDQISTAIKAGGVFISYIGHSGTATWDNSISEITQLKNNVNRNPLITDFGCSTNKFAEPDIVSFGERFLINNEGQAIGYIGNSSLGFTSTSLTLPIYFYQEMITGLDKEIGSTHLQSKIKMFNNLGSSPVYKLFALTNTLLGDPVIKIKIPDKPNLKISESDILFSNNFINDAVDSIKVKVVINNYGIKDTSKFNYSINHSFAGVVQKSFTGRRFLPGFRDTISVWISTKNLAGENTITVNLDTDNEISEIYEDDNNLNFNFYIYSTELRDIVKHRVENPVLNNTKILNPSLNNNTFHIRYQISEYDNFQNPIENTIPADSFFTSINLGGLQNNKRYYFRYRLDESNSVFSNIKSFVNKPGSDFLLTDSVSLSDQTLNDLEYQNQQLSIVPEDINISVTSAGFEAGATCIIAKDGINLLSNTFFAGMG